MMYIDFSENSVEKKMKNNKQTKENIAKRQIKHVRYTLYVSLVSRIQMKNIYKPSSILKAYSVYFCYSNNIENRKKKNSLFLLLIVIYLVYFSIALSIKRFVYILRNKNSCIQKFKTSSIAEYSCTYRHTTANR